jgi:hypothetical protein
MRTIYMANDDTFFKTEEDCRKHEELLARTVSIPVIVLEEAIRQATPYMVTAKERRELAEKLKRYLPQESAEANAASQTAAPKNSQPNP